MTLSVDDKKMIPTKDFDDYTVFVNERQRDKKEHVVNQTRSLSSAPVGKRFDSIKASETNSRFRNTTADGFNTDVKIKPALLESRVSEKQDFFNLSDGFKKCFGSEKVDRKMVIPVCGYGGHRRGERSQNFFGKNFRDTSLQSKLLERSLRSANHSMVV